MRGAIIGDVVGSRYEFDRGSKTKDFPMFDDSCEKTDDTVMTCAVADTIVDMGLYATEEDFKDHLIEMFKFWGREYPDESYGARFVGWLMSDEHEPYNSFGNGSAMRVSPVGFAYDSLDKTREVARWTAEVTHNHPEGVKGAEAVAAVIFLTRNGYDNLWIKDYIEREFDYDLSRTCDEIRPTYFHVESCQETVPEAITAFLEGVSFEDVIRNAVSLGGDCDTLTSIAGSMAEAKFGVPDFIWSTCDYFLDERIRECVKRFYRFIN